MISICVLNLVPDTARALYTGARFGDVQYLNMDDVHRDTWSLRMGTTTTPTLIPIIR